jgi:hypothetical protein
MYCTFLAGYQLKFLAMPTLVSVELETVNFKGIINPLP